MSVLTEEQKEEMRKGAMEVKEAVGEAAEEIAKAAKPAVDAVKKAAKPATTAAKKAVKPAADAVEDMAKKAAKRVAMKPEVYVQFGEKEIQTQDLVNQAKAMYKEAGNRAAVRTLRVYVKPEESAAYVVINDEFSAKIDL